MPAPLFDWFCFRGRLPSVAAPEEGDLRPPQLFDRGVVAEGLGVRGPLPQIEEEGREVQERRVYLQEVMFLNIFQLKFCSFDSVEVAVVLKNADDK